MKLNMKTINFGSSSLHTLTNPSLNVGTWHNYKISMPNIIQLNNLLISKVFNIFWADVMNKITSDNKIMILFRIKWSDGSIVTLGKALTVGPKSLDISINYIEGWFNLKDDHYHTNTVNTIIISYHIIPDKKKGAVITKMPQIPQDTTTVKFRKGSLYNKLPKSYDFRTWGHIINTALVDKNWTYTIVSRKYTYVVKHILTVYIMLVLCIIIKKLVVLQIVEII